MKKRTPSDYRDSTTHKGRDLIFLCLISGSYFRFFAKHIHIRLKKGCFCKKYVRGPRGVGSKQASKPRSPRTHFFLKQDRAKSQSQSPLHPCPLHTGSSTGCTSKHRKVSLLAEAKMQKVKCEGNLEVFFSLLCENLTS